MTAKRILITTLMLVFAVCAANKAVTPQPRQYEGPRPQAVEPPAPAQPAQPAQSPLLLTLPDGWQRSAPGDAPEGIDSALMNETLRAAILVAIYPTVQAGPRQAVAHVAASLAEKGATVSEITVAEDGLSASFTWSSAENGMGGKMVAKVLTDLPQLSVMFMGIWPAANDAAAAAALDSVAASARLRPLR